jgi:hypothetical protein
LEEIEEEATEQQILNLGTFNKDTLKGDGDCVLTGFCSDEDVIDGLRVAYFKEGVKDINELLQAGFNTWLDACIKDYEYQLSEEYAEEEILSNDYEFFENGTFFN